MAIASMVLGIVSFVGLGCIGGILAILFGHMALKQIEQSGGAETGESMAKAGVVMGWIHIALAVVVGCFMVAWVFVFIGVATVAAP